MNRKPISDMDLEPERYELFSLPAYRFEVNRRDFFKQMGGGIAVVLLLKNAVTGQESQGGRRSSDSAPGPIGAWLHIDEDGGITVFTGKVEVGQDIRTSLTQAVAEELDVPVDSIRLVMADTDLTPFDMGTFGSRTTPIMSPQLRKAAAAAREMLRDLAAEQLKVDRASIVVGNGKLTHPPTRRSAGFGELTRGQKLMKTISEDKVIKPVTEWKVAGKSIPKVNGRELVTGKHRYTTDLKLPGMLYGSVLRPPKWGATLVELDLKKAQAFSGVTVVHDKDFVGVAAASPHAATQAVQAIRAEWKSETQPSAREIFDYLKREGGGSPGRGSHSRGSIDEGLGAADFKLRQTYTIAYIAHAPLEPRAAVAEWKDGRLTVWLGTQRPFGVRRELASAFGLAEDRVRVIVPDTGSGYGGKHTGEVAVEAARLARSASKPVKVVWTREEEFAWAYFRPAGVIEVTSGVRKNGEITAWEFHNYNSGGSAIRTLYEIPNQKIEFHASRSPLRQGSYRGLAATANHFAREVHMDELAHVAGLDPLEFRLMNLKDTRLRAVFEEAANRLGWANRKRAGGIGFGIAGGFEKGGYVATCAEVSVERKTGAVKVLRAVTAFECGAVVNPDHLKNQIEGSVVMGLGGALFEAVDFADGRMLNGRFSSYRVPRFSDVPVLETVLVDRKDLPSAGAGETPIVGIAPAVGNAIFDATGSRLRSLPLVRDGLKFEPEGK